ncbi:hypothetical protein AGIG_G2550 [Arapaima gigas]
MGEGRQDPGLRKHVTLFSLREEWQDQLLLLGQASPALCLPDTTGQEHIGRGLHPLLTAPAVSGISTTVATVGNYQVPELQTRQKAHSSVCDHTSTMDGIRAQAKQCPVCRTKRG